MRKQDGSTLLLLMIFMLMVVASFATLIRSYELSARSAAEKKVVSRAELILIGFNDFFIAECSGAGNNSNAVTAPETVSDLVQQGFLPKGQYVNPFGDYELMITHQGDGTTLTVEITARDAEQAMRLSRYASGRGTVVVSGNAVRISRRTIQFEDSDYRQDASVFQSKLCV